MSKETQDRAHVMKRTSTLRHVFDERLLDQLRAGSRLYDKQHKERLTTYIREARRCGWTYALIADALRLSASRVRAIHREYQRRFDV